MHIFWQCIFTAWKFNRLRGNTAVRHICKAPRGGGGGGGLEKKQALCNFDITCDYDNYEIIESIARMLRLKGKFSSGIEGALASTLNHDFNWKQLSEMILCIFLCMFSKFIWVTLIQKQQKYK